jgi:hypothetical protein
MIISVKVPGEEKLIMFLQPERGDIGPLFEDYLLRGQIWVHTYFPIDWFKYGEVEELSIEHESTVHPHICGTK